MVFESRPVISGFCSSFILSILAALLTGLTAADEIGPRIRISVMGDDGETDPFVRDNFSGQRPAVAYNSQDNEYFVVWSGNDNSGLSVDDDNEIWGCRIDASTGAVVQAQFRISDVGTTDAVGDFNAISPSVAYNSTDNEYLVVWYGDDNTGDLVDDAVEVFGQRIDASNGAQIGQNDFRISDMGANDDDANFGGTNPDVAYNSQNNEYLVVWNGDDDTGELVNNEHEIYCQRIDASTGDEVGINDRRITDIGADGNPGFGAFVPRVAYNETQNEYLVAWHGEHLVDDAYEILGQRLNAETGLQVGVNDFRISDMGNSDADTNFNARNADVAWNAAANEYLVVWNSDDNTGALVAFENEVYGQRIDGITGAQVGTNDFRISDVGSDGDSGFGAFAPVVAAIPTNGEYLVVWYGDDNIAPLINNDFEVFMQRVSIEGDQIRENDVRVSFMGPLSNDTAYFAGQVGVAYGANAPSTLIVWNGDDNTAPLVDNEFEIFGQLLEAPGSVWVDFEYSGVEDGSIARPFNTLAEGATAVDSGGDVIIVGGTSSEVPRITKPMWISGIGEVRIGAP